MTVAAITGGARGIGRAIAQRLAADGARVAIGDIDTAAATAAAREVHGSLGFHVDVTDPASFRAFIEQTEEVFGPIDVLINNAGIMPIGPFLEEDPAVGDRAIDVNLRGTLNGVRAVLPGMVARGSGQIVNIASIAGKVATPGGIVYAATKHAIIGLGDGLRREFATRGITVTTVLPSFTNTDLVAGTRGLRGIPNVEPADVADAVARALRRRRSTVYVPALLHATATAQAVLPVALGDRVIALFGGDRAFLDIDHDERAAYEARIDPETR